MKFLTLYNVQSSQWSATNPDRQPKNHLGSDYGDRHAFDALCGVDNVEWMGGEIELNEITDNHGICIKCLRSAIRLNSDQDVQASDTTEI